MNEGKLWQLIRRHESAALAANGAGVDEYCDKLAAFVDTERALAAAFTKLVERIAELEAVLGESAALYPFELAALLQKEACDDTDD